MTTRPSASHPTPDLPPPAIVARAAIKQLADQKLPPTPDNFSSAYYEIASALAGQDMLPSSTPSIVHSLTDIVAELPAARGAAAERLRAAVKDGDWTRAAEALEVINQKQVQRDGRDLSWSQSVLHLVQALDRPHRGWTPAKKRESLTRMAEAARNDASKFHARLGQLVQSWDSGGPAEEVTLASAGASSHGEKIALDAALTSPHIAAANLTSPALTPSAGATDAHTPLILALLQALRDHLPGDSAVAREVVEATDLLVADVGAQRARLEEPATLARVRRLCERGDRVHAQRERLLTMTTDLLRAFCDNVALLADDEGWVRGQLQVIRTQLQDGLSRQTLTAARVLLRETAERQVVLKREREEAQDALKHMLATLLDRLGRVGDRTGHYYDRMGAYVQEIESAGNIETLADVVRSLLTETQEMRAEVGSTRNEMVQAHTRAARLEERVRELERELTTVSEKMLTDHLTQALNRRGLEQMFTAEAARADRRKEPLAVALLDIDNFKRLNDQMGHQAGDGALVHLTQTIKSIVRPTDIVARYGGEEFVLLLPATVVDLAVQVMERLQRTLTAEYFMHDNKKVFITFSAGVTVYRGMEPLGDVLARADDALYAAKVAGKNRVCAV